MSFLHSPTEMSVQSSARVKSANGGHLPPIAEKTILFYRNFQGFSGGHLKVWDYFRHAASASGFNASIFFTPDSLWDSGNPWFGFQESTAESWKPAEAYALFVAGLDWEAVPENLTTPVLNLIQGTRHGCPADPRYRFLKRRAVRICVSPEVAQSIRSTGLVNGPVVTIPNGIDTVALPACARERDIDVLIAGAKNPAMAGALCSRLSRRSLTAVCQTDWLPRHEFLSLMGRACVVVTLPMPLEGFFLPALEAMAMETLVVCPECSGGAGFCLDRTNGFRPSYTVEAIESDVLAALALVPEDAQRMKEEAVKAVQQHRLAREQMAFWGLLKNLNSLL